jgi:hypothetical protein
MVSATTRSSSDESCRIDALRDCIGSRRIGSAAPQARAEADVYALLFELRYHGSTPAGKVVKSAAVPMPTLSGSSAHWLKQFDDGPITLRRLANLPTPTKVRPFEVELFPKGTTLASDRAIEAIFSRGIVEGWVAFKRRYGPGGWLSVSEVLFAPDGLDALVYYEMRCGGACGEGGYVWAHRDSVQSRWSIRKRIVSWMS